MPARIHKTLMPTIPLCLVSSWWKQSARQLPWEYEKSPGAILIVARLSVKPTRTKKCWNMYQAWYKMKHPKSSDDWQEEQYNSYLGYCDQTENPLLWKEICENFDECWTNGGKSPKAIGRRIMAMRNAFASSIRGFVIYTSVGFWFMCELVSTQEGLASLLIQ
ncbi:hypothetical protein K503DRAFT_787155 [Rhizopogon vinicolor AM-OR11-026]|uniref:Uncharacterized protein n=1 Tax=Rhizopogon vinicolor AM-OR11-026 TaxID=1314800 RepID=A0A1B7MIS4_9AGAM|nr:hypothetical protein K503DRAFT_787155 [Rhizopogon vinicolor AM-OR11-026]